MDYQGYEKKRLSISDRILFAKARLNRVANRKKLLMNFQEDRLAELNEDEVDINILLIQVTKAGKEAKVRRYLSLGCHRNFLDFCGRSALHWAAEYGYLKIVYSLVEHDWDINLADNKKQTPLHIACNHHKEDVAACLIALGCNVKTADINGYTPLHRAIHTDLETIACMLCDIGANVNYKTENDWTPLHEASRTGNENIVRKLLSYGADVNAVSRCNATPFLTAVFFYRISHKCTYTALEPILRCLIENGCHLSQSDGQWVPLLASVSVYNGKIAALLLYHGCLIDQQQRCGRSLLVDTFTRCDDYVVKMLVMSGYQVHPEEVEQCAKRIPTFSRSFLRLAFPELANGKSIRCLEILEFLRQRAHNPFSLFELSRTAVRRALNTAAGDTSIVSRIPDLPIPRSIKEFVSMDDFALRYL
ncbi:hypothetical protein ACJMK2_009916 [Sinanodonta woodiana]|uniref:SOCS box domain-containing protein n=1 Tax=Sinanodonta woodiana TaxID=1069815 RepID=A0ABD3VDQ7_SINWO